MAVVTGFPQMAVSMRDRSKNAEEERHALHDIQLPCIAVSIDRSPLHEFEHEVGVRSVEQACVNETGNVGMIEAPQKATFAAETLLPFPQCAADTRPAAVRSSKPYSA